MSMNAEKSLLERNPQRRTPSLIESIASVWGNDEWDANRKRDWLMGIQTALWSMGDPASDEVSFLLDVLDYWWMKSWAAMADGDAPAETNNSI